MREYKYVSADSHLEVSPDRWRPYVAPEFQRWCPSVVKLNDGGDAWQVTGKRSLIPLGLNYSAGIGWEHLKISGISYAQNPAGAGDGVQRLQELDKDGLDAEVLYPAVWLQRSMDSPMFPPEARVAIARGYNDWLSRDFTAVDPDRLLGAAILPNSSAQDAADELRRVRAMPGIRTVVLHTWPSGALTPDLESDSVFWQAAVETGVPLSIHVQFGGGRAADVAPEGPIHIPQVRQLLTHASGSGPDTGYCVTQLITCGLFDRFPTLRFAFAETGGGWVPCYSEQADTQFRRHRYWSRLSLAHEPSFYIKRNFLWGIQDDFLAVRLRYLIGLNNLMWGSDFPHVATDWPESKRLLRRLLGDLDEAERHAIAAGNAVEFYKLRKPAAHQ